MGMLLRRYHEQEDKKDGKSSLSEMTTKELKALAKERGIEGYSSMSKDELLGVLDA